MIAGAHTAAAAAACQADPPLARFPTRRKTRAGAVSHPGACHVPQRLPSGHVTLPLAIAGTRLPRWAYSVSRPPGCRSLPLRRLALSLDHLDRSSRRRVHQCTCPRRQACNVPIVEASRGVRTHRVPPRAEWRRHACRHHRRLHVGCDKAVCGSSSIMRRPVRPPPSPACWWRATGAQHNRLGVGRCGSARVSVKVILRCSGA